MHIKKIDDSRVDEIIKVAENQSLPSHAESELHSSENAPNPSGNSKIAGSILIFILLALSLIQSIELINLRSQIQKGQFNAEAAAPAAGGGSNLPAQQGGC